MGGSSIRKKAICISLIGFEFVEEMSITIGFEKLERAVRVKIIKN